MDVILFSNEKVFMVSLVSISHMGQYISWQRIKDIQGQVKYMFKAKNQALVTLFRPGSIKWSQNANGLH